MTLISKVSFDFIGVRSNRSRACLCVRSLPGNAGGSWVPLGVEGAASSWLPREFVESLKFASWPSKLDRAAEQHTATKWARASSIDRIWGQNVLDELQIVFSMSL